MRQNNLPWPITYLYINYFRFKRLRFSPMQSNQMFSRTLVKISSEVADHFCQSFFNSSLNIIVDSSSRFRRTCPSVTLEFFTELFWQLLFNSSPKFSVNYSWFTSLTFLSILLISWRNISVNSSSIPRRTFLSGPLWFLAENFCQFLFKSLPNISVNSSWNYRRKFQSILLQFLTEHFC